jgi:molecular chaperone GrpE
LLKKFGLTEINVLGKEYNPETAECIEVVNGQVDNQVIKVHEKGYQLNGRLLKPARVSVTKIQSSAN